MKQATGLNIGHGVIVVLNHWEELVARHRRFLFVAGLDLGLNPVNRCTLFGSDAPGGVFCLSTEMLDFSCKFNLRRKNKLNLHPKLCENLLLAAFS